MSLNPAFAHVNIVARDWRKLADFYTNVFGCKPVPPERDLSGAWVDRLTGIQGVHIQGIHLRLPGYGESGPTLEIFGYDPPGAEGAKSIDSRGFAHIAFAVDDVKAALETVMTAGGGAVGETVVIGVPGKGTVTVVYATDPEGNIVELQKWSPGKK